MNLFAILAFAASNASLADHYYIVNGPEYMGVTQNEFDGYVRDKACIKVVVKKYEDQHVIVHMCEV